jgi:hypothetical protein
MPGHRHGLRQQPPLLRAGLGPQLAEALAGIGKSIAGAGAKKAIEDIDRLVAQHGGRAVDWAKMTSGTFKARNGSKVETHWYENVRTGVRVEFKSKLDDKWGSIQ